MLGIIFAVRYLLESAFCCATVKDDLGKNPYEKFTIFSLIYTAISFGLFYPTSNMFPLRLVQTLVTFLVFLLLSKRFKNWVYIFVYSLFTNLVMESLHLVSYTVVTYLAKILGISPQVYYDNLIIVHSCIVLVYTFLLFISYKVKLVNTKTVKKMSEYKFTFSIILTAIMIFYMFCKYKILSSNCHENYFNIAFAFNGASIILVIATVIVNKFVEKNAALQTKIDEILEITAQDDAKAQIGKGKEGLFFIQEQYQKEFNYIRKCLLLEGVTGRYRTNQTAFGVVLLANENNENLHHVNFRSRVLKPLSKILQRDCKTINGNIDNAIKGIWDNPDPTVQEKLADTYDGLINEENGKPSARDFMVYWAKDLRDWRKQSGKS